MKQKLLSGSLGLALVVGMLGLVSVPPLRAQDARHVLMQR